MNKAVLMSIRPEWCAKIVSGEKTFEIRKTKPKIAPPFKVYIYETQGDTSIPWMDEDGHMVFRGRGMVIGEFICSNILPMSIYYSNPKSDVANYVFPGTGLTDAQIMAYLGNGSEGFAWCIGDLRIYKTPKPLTDFKRWNRTEENAPCAHTKWLYEPCETCKSCNLKRAPQSWCYVEELGK